MIGIFFVMMVSPPKETSLQRDCIFLGTVFFGGCGLTKEGGVGRSIGDSSEIAISTDSAIPIEMARTG